MGRLDKASQRKSSSAQSPKQIIAEVIEQRKASMRYFSENYYSEMAEIYRNLHARTKPVDDGDDGRGNRLDSGDGSRTNVCVPDHFVMWRRGTSRLTRNPPNLHVRGGPDNPQAQSMTDKIAAKMMFNWDRSESQRAFKKVVKSAYAFGIGIGKSYYDEVPVMRRLRKLTSTLGPQDFRNLANAKNPQIAAAVQQFGERLRDPSPFTDQDYAQFTAAFGDEVSLNVSTVKYKGPMLDFVFFGDFFPEPGFRSLSESGYVTENSQRDEEWLEYWLAQTSLNPLTGEEGPVFDEKACQKAMDIAGQRTYIDEQELSLRRRMREEIELADPITAGKPIKAPKKRFMADERHTFIDGHLAIDFIAEESIYLGRLWYPWETYGRYQYCDMVMIPDLLGGVGMSTPIVTRFLMMLRNTRLNQTTDFINNKLLPLIMKRRGADQTAYDVVRSEAFRIVEVDNPADFTPWQDQPFPGEAWQDQASYQQAMQLADPVISDFSPGSSDVPGAGKFATTAALQAKASDAVTADTLDEVGNFIRDVVELWLWMDQQAADEDVNVPAEYMKRANPKYAEETNAASIRTAGANARYIKITPMDMQADLEILPEQGSTLAADDQFRVAGLQQFAQLGQAHPDIVNLRAVYTALARATPGINAEDVILPPPPPQPPVPPFKGTISISVKWDQLPPDVQAALLEHEGLPSDITKLQGVGHVIEHASKAADAAANLESPVIHESQNVPPPKTNGRGRRPRASAQ